jgi:signal transduction histidine kinase
MKERNKEFCREVSEQDKPQAASRTRPGDPDYWREQAEACAAELAQVQEQLRKEIREKEELRSQLTPLEKMAAVGRLAAGLAHEINNPLGVILGFSQSLLHRAGPQDPVVRPLRIIEREADRCRRLVQDLLMYSRAGIRNRERMDLNSLVEVCLAAIREDNRQSRVEWAKDLSLNLPALCLDRDQMQQILVNLCSNALDAMPDGGVLAVRTRLAEKESRPCAVLEVEDTGVGIAPDIKPRIFEPFFTTKQAGKGTGLGLALISEIVKEHEGFIEVQSEAGQGTLFRVYLPA